MNTKLIEKSRFIFIVTEHLHLHIKSMYFQNVNTQKPNTSPTKNQFNLKYGIVIR